MTTETPMTELPDGSGCFTATIMSHNEAMALPLKERPLSYRISSGMYHAVFESIGQASMCWKPIPSGVFASEQASEVAVELCFTIADELERETEKLRIYEKEFKLAVEACAFMQDEAESLGLPLGSKLPSDGVRALKKQRDELKSKLEAYKSYVELLGNELNEVIPLAAAHEWKSTRYDEGCRLRKIISETI